MLNLFLSDMFGIAFILLLTGIFAGFVAGLLGVGGGIIMVPLIAYILTQTQTGVLTAMHSAIGTSLAVIIPTSFLSAKTHMALGNVDFLSFESLLCTYLLVRVEAQWLHVYWIILP